ncbi:uncharacterized protein F4817DRAFT_315351 [Daldinia loculata]|uniref:uncharacterized protein n=1 Tax=Daldinia loculata TaxID=103429 RepID=UPI0020C20684|nr:uncharacterized protein F4817DRAFT_315351 [Daldinia loculata]KAI1647811.1 hypothetical protein F4817DRAFT_315351 [Daldinia loculata]
MSFAPRTPSPTPQRSSCAHRRRHSVKSPTIVKQYMPGLELPLADRQAQLLQQPSPFDSPTFNSQSTSAREHDLRQFWIRTSNYVPLERPLNRLSSLGTPSPLPSESLLNPSPASCGVSNASKPYSFNKSKRFLAAELYRLVLDENPVTQLNYLEAGKYGRPKKRNAATDTDMENSDHDFRTGRQTEDIMEDAYPVKRTKLCGSDMNTDSPADSQQLPHPRVHPLYAARYGKDSAWHIPSTEG